eukprot:g4692.t1
MDEDWWEKHIKGQHSKLDATCRKCEVRVTSTSLNSFMHKDTFGCGCRSKAFWSQRRDEVIAKLEERNIDASVMDEDWWKDNITHRSSKLDATCRVCGMNVLTTSVAKFMGNGSFGCKCSRRKQGVTSAPAKKAWVMRRGEVIAKLEKRNIDASNVKLWVNRREEVIERCKERDIDTSLMDSTWWRDNIVTADSKLDATCRKCNTRVTSTSIKSFMRKGIFACNCSKANRRD